MTLSKESQARDEMCRVGKSLFDRGYVHATAGNISVKLDRNAVQISGDKASKTIALHAHIYSATAALNSPAGCVIHSHSTHCVALSLQSPGAELLGPLTPYFVMKVGHVPVIGYHRPGAPEAALEVSATITTYATRGTPIRAIMLPRLGPNVWAASPAQAMAVLEELEETARLAALQPRTTPLTDAQIDELRQTFGAIW